MFLCRNGPLIAIFLSTARIRSSPAVAFLVGGGPPPGGAVAPPTDWQLVLPWAPPNVSATFTVADFTPNYLCHHRALVNIHSTARDPSELRFIVLMRDPIMR